MTFRQRLSSLPGWHLQYSGLVSLPPPPARTTRHRSSSCMQFLFRTFYNGFFSRFSRFSLRASPSQPLSRPGPPTLDCHVGTVHRSTHTQASCDHRVSNARAWPSPNMGLFTPESTCFQDGGGGRKPAPFSRCGSTQLSTILY